MIKIIISKSQPPCEYHRTTKYKTKAQVDDQDTEVYFKLKVRQAIREKYGIQKPIRDDDDYEIEDDDSIRMNNNRTGIT